MHFLTTLIFATTIGLGASAVPLKFTPDNFTLTTSSSASPSNGIPTTSLRPTSVSQTVSSSARAVVSSAPSRAVSESTGMTPSQVTKALASFGGPCAPSPNNTCRTADQIATAVNQSFRRFGLDTVGEQAAVFALMAFESGGFQFDVNVFPGRPGQGTRNMMMFDFVLPYALEFNPSAVRAIRSDLVLGRATAADVPDDQQRNLIRATVLGDELSFASGAWFLREKCKPDIALGLQSATADAWNRYMDPECVGAGQDPARLALYQAALEAMGA
ncbi:SubName: Full=Uncharacterized protein {ECO:0000313/EMBL:CCA73882.1} [Serendipita indica DSM 11827]|nr:SubName: Full=Uncharacterized protein {ECO:0000313/EMBL:CCA73882.1} [Serendipita indica DSM 11827]